MHLLPILVLAALLLGAPFLVGAHTVSLVATPAATGGDFAGLVDIGAGRRLWLECRGTGSPTVILVSGYRNDADIWDTVALGPASDKTAVLPGAAAFTRVCAYDRPGTVLGDPNEPGRRSRSDPVPMPRTIADAVADLHALLHAAGVPGPYVLVGHLLGGIIVRLYAATYPDEVVGLVLVDALPEGIQVLLTPDELARYQRLNNLVPPGLEGYRALETLDFAANFALMRQAATASPLRPMPLVILSHGQPFGVPADVLGFSPEALERAWAAGQAELAALVPGGHQIIATESGHYIQLQQPELVIDAVRAVVEAVRDPSTWATGAAGAAATPAA